MWINVNDKLPNNGESVMLKLTDGEIHEGHFVNSASKYHPNVNRWKVYKPTYKKTVAFEEVIAWKPILDDLEIAHWVEEYDENASMFLKKRWRCTACNNWQTYGKPKYCPKCGAMMEGEY